MPVASLELDAFRTQYRAFLSDLMRETGGDSASPPSWLRLLEAQPFAFPDGVASTAETVALRGRLLALAAVASRDDAYARVASAEVQRVLAAGPGESASSDHATRGPTRGATRGPKRSRPTAMAEPPDALDLGSDDMTGGAAAGAAPDDGLLSAEPLATRGVDDDAAPAPAAAAAPAAPVAAPSEPRYLNAGIQNQDRDDPLVVGETYLLQFGVDLKKGGETGTDFSARIPDQSVLMRPDEESVELTIQLDGDAFDIQQRTQVLRVPRTGKSLRKVSFAITPTKEGRATLNATVHKAGNFLFEMELSYSVGVVDARPASTEVHGRALSAATAIMPRELGLRVKPVEAGYECTVWGEINNQVTLPITTPELREMITRARDAMMDVVTHSNSANVKIFQQSVDIDDASRDYALKTLALAGAELFQRLFYGPSAGPDVILVGDWLRARATKPGRVLKLQIVAERFPIPWGLLYMGDVADGAVLDWQYFLGIKHIIEQIPRQANMLVDDYVITSNAPSLAVSVTVNTGIDVQMKRNLVAAQVDYWTARGASPKGDVQLQQRTTKADLLKALRAQSAEQVMYLYCHAITSGINDPGGIMASCLVLSGDERVTLGDLNREAPMRQPLPGNPLVFLNACESAELSPEFYDGFVPYFMAKGARGVVGTECKTPALFATAWAQEFFPRFLGGQPLGELFRDLRSEFCLKHGNPLGLLYAVYCDGDTQIQPGLSS